MGVLVALGRSQNGFRGFAQTFTEAAVSEPPVTEARATRVDCSSPPDFPFAESQFVVRRLEVQSGGVVRLGEPLPEGIITLGLPDRRRYVALGPADGIFAGAVSSQVGLNPEGKVRTIRLEYLESLDPETVASTLAEEMGRAGTEFAHSLVWEDPTATLTVSERDGRVWIDIRDPRVR